MTRRLLRIVDVAHAGDYRLALQFSDGSNGVADMGGQLTDVLAPLSDPALFAQAFIDGETVAWPGDLDVAAEFLYALAHHLPPPTTGEEVARNELVVSLRELRNFAGKTQAEVGEAAGLAQSEVSRIEGRDDALLTTLRRYVEALGGELELVARFGNKAMKIGGIG
jgi:hypothetical protein